MQSGTIALYLALQHSLCEDGTRSGWKNWVNRPKAYHALSATLCSDGDRTQTLWGSAFRIGVAHARKWQNGFILPLDACAQRLFFSTKQSGEVLFYRRPPWPPRTSHSRVWSQRIGGEHRQHAQRTDGTIPKEPSSTWCWRKGRNHCGQYPTICRRHRSRGTQCLCHQPATRVYPRRSASRLSSWRLLLGQPFWCRPKCHQNCTHGHSPPQGRTSLVQSVWQLSPHLLLRPLHRRRLYTQNPARGNRDFL